MANNPEIDLACTAQESNPGSQGSETSPSTTEPKGSPQLGNLGTDTSQALAAVHYTDYQFSVITKYTNEIIETNVSVVNKILNSAGLRTEV